MLEQFHALCALATRVILTKGGVSLECSILKEGDARPDGAWCAITLAQLVAPPETQFAMVVVVTEAGASKPVSFRFNRSQVDAADYLQTRRAFILDDANGDEVRISFLDENGPLALPDVWIVVQEGGSSAEAYVHGFSSEEDALAARASWAAVAYRSSRPIQLSGALECVSDFYEVAEMLAAAFTDFGYPDE